MKSIPLADLHPHPGNPRLAPREDVVEQIAAQLNGTLDEAHALIVRPNGSAYQIISGHHRALAAERAGIREVPCWVRDMSDEDAYMALALNNAQGELHPLEVGLHALKSPLSVREYADRRGDADHTNVARMRRAAEVAEACGHVATADPDRWRHLAEIHAAPRWLWHALVSAVLDKGWSVDQTRNAVKRVKDAADPPEWADAEAIADAIVSGEAKPILPTLMQKDVDLAEKRIRENEADYERFLAALDRDLKDRCPAKGSEIAEIINGVLSEQEAILREQREAEAAAQREQEAAQARIARLREYCSLEEWKTLATAEKDALLAFTASSGPSFNRQENADIEWAQWSWNPITGCLHDCPYCYARDIANQKRMQNVYPNAFAPTLRPIHLLAPQSQKPPKEASTDARYRNVFTGSMADIFGRWVPAEWIEAVLAQMRAAPQWNFLCLTKFPKRMSEFDIPLNTWMGTTVDLQARVPAAEAAFSKVNAAVKWLSVEPMLEPLKFTRLELFDWIVIGGASASTKTPEWHPPIAWIVDLYEQARAAGVAVYMKSNLLHETTARILELPGGLPVTADPSELPEAFRYLGRAKTPDQEVETAPTPPRRAGDA